MSDDRDLVYYYSKERREARRRPSAGGEKTVRIGPFKTTVGGRANFIFFFTLLLIIFMFSLGRRITANNQGLQLGGNTISMNIVKDEEMLVLNIIKTAPQRGEVYLGTVQVSVAPEGSSDLIPSFSQQITFNPVDVENFRIFLPFAGSDFFVTLMAGEEQRSIRLSVLE